MSRFSLHTVHHVPTCAGTLSCLVHEPPGFSDGDRRPCLLFLHGSEERGSDLSRVARLGIPALIERGRNLPFVTISPQCPNARTWDELTDALGELLDARLPQLSIDMRRVYLTGVSMGGFGAWKLAAEQPWRFAALAPVCGGGDPSWAPRLRDLPTWAFHGAEDEIVPAEHSKRMVEALERLGSPVRLTIFQGVGHDAWTRAYDMPQLYDWMLGQLRLETRDAPQPALIARTDEHGA